jgi:hypothetical protein
MVFFALSKLLVALGMYSIYLHALGVQCFYGVLFASFTCVKRVLRTPSLPELWVYINGVLSFKL